MTHDLNTPGIQVARLFVRGKPYAVAIDSVYLMYKNGYVDPNNNNEPLYMAFAKADRVDKVVWPSVLEKAWAKVKGNYVIAEGGYLVEGIRALTGLPGFSYSGSKVVDGTLNSADTFNLLKAGDAANYIQAAGTSGGSD